MKIEQELLGIWHVACEVNFYNILLFSLGQLSTFSFLFAKLFRVVSRWLIQQ